MSEYDSQIDPEDLQDQLSLLAEQQGGMPQDAALSMAGAKSSNPVADAILASMLKRQQASDEGLALARGARNENNRVSNILQGFTSIGTGLAGQKADPSYFNSLRDQNNLQAQEALSDSDRNRKAVSDAIKQKLLGQYQNQSLSLKKQMIDAAKQSRDEKLAKPTDANTNAAGFGKRIEQAENIFDELGKAGYSRADKSSAADAAASNLPVVGGAYSAFFQGENTKKQDQAERNFINAVLRRESGAAIAQSEFDNAEAQYFPRVGDTEEVLNQKKANRQQALATLKVASGPAWEQVPLVGKPKNVSGGLNPAEKARLEQLRAKRNQ